MTRAFFCGIGGSGMSALARLLLSRGWTVAGSDRSRDRGETPEKFASLAALGLGLFPQDGSGLTPETSMLIVSSAVEDTIPDVQAARRLNIPIRKRAEVLAELFNGAKLPIGIAGTSGKSTVTAMTGWILSAAGFNPTIVNGAAMANFSALAFPPPGGRLDGGDSQQQPNFEFVTQSSHPPIQPSPRRGEGFISGGVNAVAGNGNTFVAELDESDGSVALFNPVVAVLTNVTLDHKPLPELRLLFSAYLSRAESVVINLDDPEAATLAPAKAVTFSLTRPDATLTASDIAPMADGVTFTVAGTTVSLRIPGRHNVANALAALAAARAAGVPLGAGAKALATYRGISRRFEIVGTANGVTVIDDFAHNPDKIAATLRTLHERPGRVIAIFQPHGFGPTRLMREALVETFAAGLNAGDLLIMPEIYYAGGTAAKDISSADIVRDVAAAGRQARFIERRADIVPFIADIAKAGDRIIVMGARDDTLPAFARAILSALS